MIDGLTSSGKYFRQFHNKNKSDYTVGIFKLVLQTVNRGGIGGSYDCIMTKRGHIVYKLEHIACNESPKTKDCSLGATTSFIFHLQGAWYSTKILFT